MIEPLLRTDEKLAELAWPRLESVADPKVGSGQTIIVVGGFEDRARAYLDESLKNGSTGFRVIAIEYRPHYDENRKARLEDQCRSGIKPVWILYDRYDPAGIGERILTEIGQDTSLMVDISGMSRLLIVQLSSNGNPPGFAGETVTV